jgi:hypothetical protein
MKGEESLKGTALHPLLISAPSVTIMFPWGSLWSDLYRVLFWLTRFFSLRWLFLISWLLHMNIKFHICLVFSTDNLLPFSVTSLNISSFEIIGHNFKFIAPGHHTSHTMKNAAWAPCHNNLSYWNWSRLGFRYYLTVLSLITPYEHKKFKGPDFPLTCTWCRAVA